MIVQKIKCGFLIACLLIVCQTAMAGHYIKEEVHFSEETHQKLLVNELYGDTGTGKGDIHIHDPLYHLNYLIYAFNDSFYFYLLKPVASGYKQITPEPVREGIQNFFYNLLAPVRFVNNMLQGKFQSAGTEIEIFLVNSTIGLAGFMTPAQDHFDLQTSDEDFGQTLGFYHIGNGFYLVLPFLGPSSLRDTIGLIGDSFLKPVTYVESEKLSMGLTVFDTVNKTSFVLGNYETFKQSALDPYQALKNAYIQSRYYKIHQ